jgi:hypothetical protein
VRVHTHTQIPRGSTGISFASDRFLPLHLPVPCHRLSLPELRCSHLPGRAYVSGRAAGLSLFLFLSLFLSLPLSPSLSLLRVSPLPLPPPPPAFFVSLSPSLSLSLCLSLSLPPPPSPPTLSLSLRPSHCLSPFPSTCPPHTHTIHSISIYLCSSSDLIRTNRLSTYLSLCLLSKSLNLSISRPLDRLIA